MPFFLLLACMHVCFVNITSLWSDKHHTSSVQMLLPQLHLPCFKWSSYGPSLWLSLLLCYCSSNWSLRFFLILSECVLHIFFFSSFLLSMSFHVSSVILIHSLCTCLLKPMTLSLALVNVSFTFRQCTSICSSSILLLCTIWNLFLGSNNNSCLVLI